MIAEIRNKCQQKQILPLISKYITLTVFSKIVIDNGPIMDKLPES